VRHTSCLAETASLSDGRKKTRWTVELFFDMPCKVKLFFPLLGDRLLREKKPVQTNVQPSFEFSLPAMRPRIGSSMR